MASNTALSCILVACLAGSGLSTTPWWTLTTQAPWTARSGLAIADAGMIGPKLMGLFLTGGTTSLEVPFNDVWGSPDNGATWSLWNASAGWSPRFLHTMNVAGASTGLNNLFLIGGFNSGEVPNNEVWRTANGRSWTLVTSTPGFAPRGDHATAVTLGQLVVSGGRTGAMAGDLHLNDVWRSTGANDNAQWALACATPGWSPRSGHRMAASADVLFVIGGITTGDVFLNDVWTSEDRGSSWSQLIAAAPWSARSAFASVVDPPVTMSNRYYRIWVMGGVGDSGALNDVWYMEPDVSGTFQLSQSAPLWSPRYDAAAAASEGAIVLAGGVALVQGREVKSAEAYSAAPTLQCYYNGLECGGNGICNVEFKESVCRCNSGYAGAYCSSPQCPGGCGSGTCAKPGSCACPTGYTGPQCMQAVNRGGAGSVVLATLCLLLVVVLVVCVCIRCAPKTAGAAAGGSVYTSVAGGDGSGSDGHGQPAGAVAMESGIGSYNDI